MEERKMNNTFDMTRFAKLLKYDVANVLHHHVLFLMMSAIPLVGFWLMGVLIGGSGVTLPETRLMTGLVVTYCAMAMSPSFVYGVVNLPNRGIGFAMLPASKCEKFWSMMLVTLVGIPLMNVLSLFVVDTLLWVLPFGPFHQSLFSCFEGLDDLSTETPALGVLFVLSCISSVVNNHSQFTFTNTIFKRYKVILTILCICLIGVALSMIALPIMVRFGVDDGVVDAWLREGSAESRMAILLGMGIALNMLIAVGLYVWTYCRMKKASY